MHPCAFGTRCILELGLETKKGGYNGYTIHQGMSPHHWRSSLPKYMCDTTLRGYECKRMKPDYKVTKSYYNSANSWDPHNFPHHSNRSHAAVNLGVLALNTRFHDTRVTENDDG